MLERLSREIAAGAVIGYPTDTIWGFGCDPLNHASVQRILDIKGRGRAKGLILLASSLDQCEGFIDVDSEQRRTLGQPCERPTTWLVNAGEACPAWIRGQHPTVAVRITRHPLIRQLCESLGFPLVSTSANRSGRATVRNALQMQRQFGDEVDYVITGFSTGGGGASEIKSLATGQVLRASS